MAGDEIPRSEDIIENLRIYVNPRQSIIDDPTCESAQSTQIDEEDEDEEVMIDFDLIPPDLTVLYEVVKCRKRKSWINLTVEYEPIEGFEYEFEIVEAD